MIRKNRQASHDRGWYISSAMMPTTRPTTQSDYHQRMLRVLVHIQQHLDQPLPLHELAAIAHFSPYHFHRIFRGMIGETVAQHIKRLRLERAALRLRTTSRSIIGIALEAGYESHEGFTRAFAGSFSCSPSVYREKASALTETDASSQVDQQLNVREAPAMDVMIKTIPEMHIAFMRHVGPYGDVGPSWEMLFDWAGERDLVNGETRYFGMCHDDPDITDAQQLRYDACLTVHGDVRPSGVVGIQTIPGGRFACTMHVGPYHTLNETYIALFGGWFASQGIEPGPPPCLEFYLNEPDCTPPQELLTEVCARVE